MNNQKIDFLLDQAFNQISSLPSIQEGDLQTIYDIWMRVKDYVIVSISELKETIASYEVNQQQLYKGLNRLNSQLENVGVDKEKLMEELKIMDEYSRTKHQEQMQTQRQLQLQTHLYSQLQQQSTLYQQTIQQVSLQKKQIEEKIQTNQLNWQKSFRKLQEEMSMSRNQQFEDSNFQKKYQECDEASGSEGDEGNLKDHVQVNEDYQKDGNCLSMDLGLEFSNNCQLDQLVFLKQQFEQHIQSDQIQEEMNEIEENSRQKKNRNIMYLQIQKIPSIGREEQEQGRTCRQILDNFDNHQQKPFYQKQNIKTKEQQEEEDDEEEEEQQQEQESVRQFHFKQGNSQMQTNQPKARMKKKDRKILQLEKINNDLKNDYINQCQRVSILERQYQQKNCELMFELQFVKQKFREAQKQYILGKAYLSIFWQKMEQIEKQIENQQNQSEIKQKKISISMKKKIHKQALKRHLQTIKKKLIKSKQSIIGKANNSLQMEKIVSMQTATSLASQSSEDHKLQSQTCLSPIVIKQSSFDAGLLLNREQCDYLGYYLQSPLALYQFTRINMQDGWIANYQLNCSKYMFVAERENKISTFILLDDKIIHFGRTTHLIYLTCLNTKFNHFDGKNVMLGNGEVRIVENKIRIKKVAKRRIFKGEMENGEWTIKNIWTINLKQGN